MEEQISRLETLEFIEYLRTKEDVMIESQILNLRTFFNRYKLDMGVRARVLLGIIKRARSASEAYRAVAHETAKQNSLWKTFPEGGYMFHEDYDEFIEENPDVLKDEVIQKWHSNGWLESRDIFQNYFPMEYVRFSMTLADPDSENFAVISRSVNTGAYNYYRQLKTNVCLAEQNMDNKIPKNVTIGYDSNECSIDLNKLIPLCKLICEQCGAECVSIADYSSDEVVNVYKIE